MKKIFFQDLLKNKNFLKDFKMKYERRFYVCVILWVIFYTYSLFKTTIYNILWVTWFLTLIFFGLTFYQILLMQEKEYEKYTDFVNEKITQLEIDLKVYRHKQHFKNL